MLPFEFTVVGPPVSLQAKDAERLREWRNRVQQAARVEWPNGADPEGCKVRLQVTYYHDADSPKVDADNIIKPIQDALIGLIYADDRQVVDVDCAKRDVDGPFRVRRVSPCLAAAFVEGQEFLHIKVERAPNPQELRR